jgi:hypothetical protein
MVCNLADRIAFTNSILRRLSSRYSDRCTRILFDERSAELKGNDSPTKQATRNNWWMNSSDLYWSRGGAINCCPSREPGSGTWSSAWAITLRSGWFGGMAHQSPQYSVCATDPAWFTNMGAQMHGSTALVASRFCSGNSLRKVRRRGRRRSILAVLTGTTRVSLLSRTGWERREGC